MDSRYWASSPWSVSSACSATCSAARAAPARPAPQAGGARPEGGQPGGNEGGAARFGPRSLPGLVAYWPFDEGRGQEVKDASGNNSPGTVHGGEWTQGVNGSAVQLHGPGNFIDLGTGRKL